MPQTLEERVALLEQEVKELRRLHESQPTAEGNNQWVNAIFGMFKDDPLYDKAAQAGAAYRKAQVPDYMTMAEERGL